MKILPSWDERLQKADAAPAISRLDYGLKKSPRYYAKQTNFVDTLEKGEALLDFALQRPLSHIGFDTEFRYDRPGVVIDKRNKAHDPRSIRPLLLSLAMAEPDGDDAGCLYSFVVDLRNPEMNSILNTLFRVPLIFCGHFAKAELFCLWQLGLAEPDILWDTFIFEKALQLGRFHPKYKLTKAADVFEQIQVKEDVDEATSFGFSLVATCQRYGVTYGMATEKGRLQQSFLTHPDGAGFSQEQIDYAAEDAVAAARLYPLQAQKAVQTGLLRHCETVEMPWVITNARIEWTGVRVDEQRRDHAIATIGALKGRLETHLAVKYNIQNPQSHKQLTAFFQECGLLHPFIRGGKISFDKKILKMNVGLHPAIVFLRAARRASDLLADKLLSADFVGEDGRIRAEHRQLGTDTGRQTSRWPNFLGLDRVLRPLVIPEAGYGIGEVDWSQVEVGIAAAVYGDDALVQMFNTGDVYSAMAQHFFREALPAEDRCRAFLYIA